MMYSAVRMQLNSDDDSSSFAADGGRNDDLPDDNDRRWVLQLQSLTGLYV